MNETPSLIDWIWAQAMLTQGFLGSISCNVRQISLSFKNRNWQVEVILEKAILSDYEEIEDAIDETAIFMEDIRDHISYIACAKFECVISVYNGKNLQAADTSRRIVYRRREGFTS